MHSNPLRNEWKEILFKHLKPHQTYQYPSNIDASTYLSQQTAGKGESIKNGETRLE